MNRSFGIAIAAGGILAAAGCVQKQAATTSAPVAQPQATMASDTGMRGEGRRGMGGMNPDRMEAMLFNGITLTASQQAQVDSIHARHRTEMQGLDPRNNPGDREKMRQMMQTHMAEIRAVLTPEQQAVFDQNVQQMRDRRSQRMGGAPPRE